VTLQLINFIGTLFEIYKYMMIGYILLSWFPNGRESFIGVLLGKVVEPYLSVFRRFIPPLGMFDFSPIVAYIALWPMQIGVVRVLEMLLR